MSRYLAAAVQLSCTSDAARNHTALVDHVRRAAAYGAKLVVTPENTNFLGPHPDKVRTAEPLDGALVQTYQALAASLGIHLVIGSVNERAEVPGKCHNTSLLIGPDGTLLASYRKIHLFDVDIPPDVRFLESDTVVAGQDTVVAPTSCGNLGMSICYDLRFPELYRALVDKGAEVLLVPSAFTLTTGKDHWTALLRARAIESQSYVIAPGQYGLHDDKGLRQSYGHSLIVDPWGHVVGMASDGEGLALAEIDLERVRSTRRGMPVAQHRRL